MRNESERRYRIITLAKAAEMMKDHVAFLARVSADAAERLKMGYIEAAKSLEVMPKRCPWFKGEFIPSTTFRALSLNKRCLILFKIEEETVFIYYVLDCSQDYRWLLND